MGASRVWQQQGAVLPSLVPLYPVPLFPCTLYPRSTVPCTLFPCTLYPRSPVPSTPVPLYPVPSFPCNLYPRSPVPYPRSPVPCTPAEGSCGAGEHGTGTGSPHHTPPAREPKCIHTLHMRVEVHTHPAHVGQSAHPAAEQETPPRVGVGGWPPS